MSWIARRIDTASWTRFAIWFAVLFAFSAWAFTMDSPWTRALAAAGGVLPETQPGFSAAEPALSLGRLGAAKSDYILWQALDIPYAIMNLMVASLGMGLGLKKARLQATPLRFLLLLPVVYVACELVENTFVALFAAGALGPERTLVQVQQTATIVKFASGYSSMLLGLAGVLVAAIAQAVGLMRRKRT